jgi:hypothetical protein
MDLLVQQDLVLNSGLDYISCDRSVKGIAKTNKV